MADDDGMFYYHRLLSVEELQDYLSQVMDIGCKRIVCEALKYSFFVEDGFIYNYDPLSKVWKAMRAFNTTTIGVILGNFFHQTISILSKADISSETHQKFNNLQTQYPKEYQKLLNGKFEKNLAQYERLLTSLDEFDIRSRDIIHFRNGYFDLKEQCFFSNDDPVRGRDSTWGVKSFINFNFQNPITDAAVIEFVNTTFDSIIPCEYRAYMEYYLGSCLQSAVQKDCNFLLIYGDGSNGKSTLINILKSIFKENVYSKSYGTNVFSSVENFNRNLQGLKPEYRFIFVEELEPTVKAVNNLKKLADGTINVKPVYKKDTVPIEVRGKLFMTSNSFINFDPTGEDGGIQRRILYLKVQTTFVKDETLVDHSKGIYLANPMLTEQAINRWDETLKTAFFLKIANGAQNFYNGIVVPVPPGMIITTPPTIASSIKKVVVRGGGYIIGAIDLLTMIRTHGGFPKADLKDLTKFFKTVGVKYDANRKDSSGICGCFIDVIYTHQLADIISSGQNYINQLQTRKGIAVEQQNEPMYNEIQKEESQLINRLATLGQPL